MFIAVNFDGTCVKDKWPDIGEDIGAIPVLKDLVNSGHFLILSTFRKNKELEDAKNWFKKNEIPLFENNSNDIHANLYISNLALGTILKSDENYNYFLDWDVARILLEASGIIE